MTTYSKQIEKQLLRVRQTIDGLGMPIDKEIELLVASLLAYGFSTSGSCGGHVDRPLTLGPWVDIESPEGAKLTDEKRATKPREWWFGIDDPGYKAFAKEVAEHNIRAQLRLLELIENFYCDRKMRFDTLLVVRTRTGLRNLRLECQGADLARLPERHDRYPEWVHAAQTEMQDFAEFLAAKI